MTLCRKAEGSSLYSDRIHIDERTNVLYNGEKKKKIWLKAERLNIPGTAAGGRGPPTIRKEGGGCYDVHNLVRTSDLYACTNCSCHSDEERQIKPKPPNEAFDGFKPLLVD